MLSNSSQLRNQHYNSLVTTSVRQGEGPLTELANYSPGMESIITCEWSEEENQGDSRGQETSLGLSSSFSHLPSDAPSVIFSIMAGVL